VFFFFFLFFFFFFFPATPLFNCRTGSRSPPPSERAPAAQSAIWLLCLPGAVILSLSPRAFLGDGFLDHWSLARMPVARGLASPFYCWTIWPPVFRFFPGPPPPRPPWMQSISARRWSVSSGRHSLAKRICLNWKVSEEIPVPCGAPILAGPAGCSFSGRRHSAS